MEKHYSITFKRVLHHCGAVFKHGSVFSDDTGCPSSQCASPTKTLSGSDNSPMGSPSLGERTVKVKRVRMNVVAEWSEPTQKHKREKQQPASIMHKGHFISAILATFYILKVNY